MEELDFLGDIGNIDLPDININLLDFVPTDGTEETRYTVPKVARHASDYVLYDNAVKMAKDLRLDFGQRFDAFVSGSFIFGDFIEAFLTTNNACAKRMVISTLSLSQDNVDSLFLLMDKGYVKQLDLIVSAYFWGNERMGLIPYIYRQLDMGDRFQLAVAGIHTKTCHFETLGGRKIVMHGSEPAQLRQHRAVHDGGEPGAVRLLRPAPIPHRGEVRHHPQAHPQQQRLGALQQDAIQSLIIPLAHYSQKSIGDKEDGNRK